MESNNIYPLHKDKTIQAEARSWVLKFNGDSEPTTEEIESLKQWASQSPAHRIALEQAQTIWEEADRLSALAVPTRRRKSKVWTPNVFQSLYTLVGSSVGRLATTFLILGCALTLSLTIYLQPNKIGNGDYVTAVGEQRTLTLLDSSEVQLDTNSSIRVSYNDSKREIYLLTGKAHFKVAKNPDRPFEVYAQNGMVRAVGTAFSVDLTHYDVKVIVDEGQVDLARVEPQPASNNKISNDNDINIGIETSLLENNKRPVVFTSLKAGQSAQFDEITEKVKALAAPELSKELAWRKGMLIFAGEPLHTVISEITRYTDIKITVLNPTLNQLQVGGRFKVGELEALLDVLEVGFGIQITRVDKHHIELNSTSS